MKTELLRIRIEPEFKEQLQEAIMKGKAENLSALIRLALSEFLETNHEAQAATRSLNSHE